MEITDPRTGRDDTDQPQLAEPSLSLQETFQAMVAARRSQVGVNDWWWISFRGFCGAVPNRPHLQCKQAVTSAGTFDLTGASPRRCP